MYTQQSTLCANTYVKFILLYGIAVEVCKLNLLNIRLHMDDKFAKKLFVGNDMHALDSREVSRFKKGVFFLNMPYLHVLKSNWPTRKFHACVSSCPDSTVASTVQQEDIRSNEQ